MSDITGRSLPFKLRMQMRQIALPRFAALARRQKKRSHFIQLQVKNRLIHSLQLRLAALEQETPRVHLSREEALFLSAEIGVNGMFHDCDIEIAYFNECVGDDGETMPAGMYLLAAEYSEEGRMPLFDTGLR